MTENKRATEDLLDSLHGMTADAYLHEIKRLKKAKEPIPPALLSSCTKFLKDNGVDRAMKEGDKLDLLGDELEMEFADNVVSIKK